MSDVSRTRLYVLRATYLLIALGMGTQIWPGLLSGGSDDVAHMTGVVRAMLGALTLLCLLGVRHPLAMLPLLFWELAWKAIWVAVIGVPLWLGGRFTPPTFETWTSTLPALVLVPLVLPWGYVWRHYGAAGRSGRANASRHS